MDLRKLHYKLKVNVRQDLDFGLMHYSKGWA